MACSEGANSSSLRASAEPSRAWSIPATSFLPPRGGPSKHKAWVPVKGPAPAAFLLVGQSVEPPRNIGCRLCGARGIAGDLRAQHAGDGGLLGPLAVIAGG